MSHLHNFLEEFAQRSGLRGKFTKRLFGSMLAGFQAAQRDIEESRRMPQENAAVLEELAAQIQEMRSAFEAEKRALQLRLDAAEQANAALCAQLSPDSAILQNVENLNVNLRSNNAQIASLQCDNALCKTKLAGLERRLNTASIPVQSNAPKAEPRSAAGTGSDYDVIDYFDFENHFRGSIAQIKEAQRMYLPYFEGKKHVLDIGCGRGEFLSLLKEEGIPAEGVDVYEPYIDYCRMQGFSAKCGDGIAHLAGMDSADGIFVGQVVEHLTTEQIVQLCNTAYEKLSDGGCIVIETPNPTSLAIYTGAFYIDPSHVKPVHPLTMQYFLEKAGFKQIEILYPEQSRPDVQIGTADPDILKMKEILFGAQDYAVIAVK